MNFEEAFKHYQNGTATPEEKEYVKSQLDAAKAFSELMDDEGINVTPAPIAEADIQDVKKAKQQIKTKYVIIPICCIIAIFVAVGAILGGVFGYASSCAKKSMKYSKSDCAMIAKYAVLEIAQDGNGLGLPFVNSIDDMQVKKINRDFMYNSSDMKKSYYKYDVKIKVIGCEFDVEVDTVSGRWRIVDVDRN